MKVKDIIKLLPNEETVIIYVKESEYKGIKMKNVCVFKGYTETKNSKDLNGKWGTETFIDIEDTFLECDILNLSAGDEEVIMHI